MTRKRVLRWLLAGLAVPAALILVVALALALIDWGFLRDEIEQRASEALGREVEVGDLGVQILPTPRLTLKQLRIANPDWSNAANLLEVERLTVVPDLGALLRGRLEAQRLDLESPRLAIEQAAGRQPNWDLPIDASGSAAAAPATEGGPAASPDRPEPFDWPVGRLNIRDARVHYLDHGSGRDVALRIPALNAAPTENGLRFDVRVVPSGRPQIELAGQLRRDESSWILSGLQAKSADSDLSGEVRVQLGHSPTQVVAHLRSQRLNLTAWRPENEPKAAGFDWPRLPDLKANVQLGAQRVDLPERWLPKGRLEAVKLNLDLSDNKLRVYEAGAALGGGRVALEVALSPSVDALHGAGKIALEKVDLQRAASDLGLTLPSYPAELGSANGGLQLALDDLPRQDITARALLARLRFTGGELNYRQTEPEMRLTLRPRTLEGNAPRPLRIIADGQMKQQPIQATLRLDPLSELLADRDNDFQMALEAHSRSLTVGATTTLARLTGPDGRSFDVRLAFADAADLDVWLPTDLPPLPATRVSGVLRHDEAWRLSRLDARVGDTKLTGSLRFEPGERPFFGADLAAARLDIDALNRLRKTGSDRAAEGSASDVPAPDVAKSLAGFDAELRLKAAAVSYEAVPGLGGVTLHATLDRGLVTLRRLDFAAAAGQVRASGKVNARQTPLHGQFAANFDRLRVASLWDSATTLQEGLGVASGQLKLDAVARAVPAADAQVLLPLLGRLRAHGKAHFSAPEKGTDFDLELHTEELNKGAQRTLASANGHYRGVPLDLSFTGDSLLDIRDPQRPYATDLELSLGETRFRINGSITRPLAMAGLDLEMHVQGPDPRRLYDLFGIPFPALPPYRLEGQLTARGPRWALTDLSGRVGDSDLSGELSLNASGARPMIRADLRSRSLDFDDLAGLVGAVPDTGPGETASPAQKRRAKAAADDPDVLPETEFGRGPLRAADARVSYRGDRVSAGGLPLDNLTIEMRLEDGVMTLEPLDFGIGGGDARLRLSVDARRTPLQAVLEAKIRHVDLRRVLRDVPMTDDSKGIVGGRGKLWMRGRSSAELLASADGGVNLLMAGGKLDAPLVEMAGLDLGETLLARLTDRPAIPIECAYADLQFRDGLMRLDEFVVDSVDTLFEVNGNVDFGDETVDVTILPYPKDISGPAAGSPLYLRGRFGAVDLQVVSAELALRSLAAAGLAAVAGPFAALLPLVETGSGDDSAYCRGFVESLMDTQRGAPTS